MTRNLKVNFRRYNEENRWKVTEEERAYARKCKYPKDLQDFTKEVCFSGKSVVLAKKICRPASKTIEGGI